MKKILFLAPHLSTGGLPQYLTKKIELIKNEFDPNAGLGRFSPGSGRPNLDLVVQVLNLTAQIPDLEIQISILDVPTQI